MAVPQKLRIPMIIVVRPNATEAQIQHILDRVQELGFKSHYSRGEHRTVIGVIGDDRLPLTETFAAIDGVEQVVRILKPFKLAGRELRPDDSIVRVGPVKIGGGSLALIAGPCAVEDLDGLRRIAGRVRAAGANMLRGGAFKPRTSPYSFQGLGVEGLRMLRQIGDEFAMPVVTEVMNVRQIGVVCEFADMLQIGARNMQNFDLLREVGQAKKPVLLKRGMSATVKDLLMSAEYVLASGNPDVVLCERGVRSFEDSTRNMLDMSAVPNVKSQSHLPIIVDPSHATGRADLVPAMARSAIAAGADGVIVEVHDCPERALSDGAQALLPDGFDQLMKELRRIIPAVGKEVG
jgi:3-deoxy-7-phosphoheptulonate synthase